MENAATANAEVYLEQSTSDEDVLDVPSKLLVSSLTPQLQLLGATACPAAAQPPWDAADRVVRALDTLVSMVTIHGRLLVIDSDKSLESRRGQ
ncbi:MAG TPA: hypothetical protein VN748_17970 [Pseudonocardiaceae bacterium]|nr:hypothetical protein [Pseudonocardiaceae bacterium]